MDKTNINYKNNKVSSNVNYVDSFNNGGKYRISVIKDVTSEYIKDQENKGIVSIEEGYAINKKEGKDEIEQSLFYVNLFGGEITLLNVSQDTNGHLITSYDAIWLLNGIKHAVEFKKCGYKTIDIRIRKALKQLKYSESKIIALNIIDYQHDLNCILDRIEKTCCQRAYDKVDVLIRVNNVFIEAMRFK